MTPFAYISATPRRQLSNRREQVMELPCPVVTGYRLTDYSSSGAGAPWFLLLIRGGRAWGLLEEARQLLNISLGSNS